MQNPELFACLSKERKENLLGTLLFRPSIYERLYYEGRNGPQADRLL